MNLDANFVTNGLRDSITELTAWMKKNPSALDMVSYDYRSVPETCDIRDCESEAEFFIFDPTTNDEFAHVCLNCFEQATNGAAGGTTAYFARIEAVMGEREVPVNLEWEEVAN